VEATKAVLAPNEAPAVTTEIAVKLVPETVKFIIAVAAIDEAGVKVKVGATVTAVP
jgi:hypothetical protein